MNSSVQLRSWTDLPSEIVNRIFESLLSQEGIVSNFIQCQLICKKWRELAQKHMYYFIEITSVNQLLELCARLCSPNSNASKYVKIVLLYIKDEPTAYYGGILRLLLTVSVNINGIFVAPHQSRLLIKGMLKAYDQGSCRHIERLPAVDPSWGEEDLADYQDISFKLCNSLIDVTVLPCPEETGLKRLKHFRKLSELHVNLDNLDTLHYIGKYLNDCPTAQLFYLNGKWQNNTLQSTQAREDFVACQHVRTCSILGIRLTETIFQFIIHALPNVDTLTIDRTDTDEEIKVANTVCAEFLNHIHSKVDRFFLNSLRIAGYSKVLSTYLRTMVYHDLILELNYSRGRQGNLPLVNMYTLRHRTFEISQKYTAAPRTCINVIYPDTVDDDTVIPPHLELVEAAGSHLKFLSFTGTRSYHSTYELYCGFYLDHILKHCTKLTTLIVSGHYRFIDFNQDRSYIPNKSVSTLRLKHCGISAKILPQLPVRLPALKHLLLCDIWFIDLYGDRQESSSNYTLDMADMSLDLLTWEGRSHLNPLYYKNIHVKLVRPDKTSFIATYTRTQGKLSKFTDAEFNKVWNENEALCRDDRSRETKGACFLIQSADVKTFDIIFDYERSNEHVEFHLDKDCDAYYASSS